MQPLDGSHVSPGNASRLPSVARRAFRWQLSLPAQALQQFQQFGRIISLKMIIRAWADSGKRCTNVYHWPGRSDFLNCSHEFRTRHLVCVGIDDNSVHSRKSLEDLDRLMSAVRSKHIEFCSFNHWLA